MSDNAASFNAGEKSAAAPRKILSADPDTLIAEIRRRLESRYRRICFVQSELEKLHTTAKPQTAQDKAAAPAPLTADKSAVIKPAAFAENSTAAKRIFVSTAGGSFEDFVFKQIDFSVYKKIDAIEFGLLFDKGLEDFSDSFFTKKFDMDRESVRQTIKSAYIKVGPFYVSKTMGTLLLSIMRTLHTSLEFTPLLMPGEFENAGQFRSIVAALSGVVIRHDDGRETKLFTDGGILRGTFMPQGKAYTIVLANDSQHPQNVHAE